MTKTQNNSSFRFILSICTALIKLWQRLDGPMYKSFGCRSLTGVKKDSATKRALAFNFLELAKPWLGSLGGLGKSRL